MIKYNDRTGASFQKLEQVLSQYAVMEGFNSELLSRDKQLSEDIVRTILSEIQKFLVGESDCEIDQVSGRIETKLARLGAEGVSITDESLEKIKTSLGSVFQSYERTQTNDDGLQKSAEAQQDFTENVRDNDDEFDESDEDESVKTGNKKSNSDLSEQIFDILNNINKDKKLNDFKEFLSTISPKQRHFSLFKRSITAKTLDEILPKVKFFKRYHKMIEKTAIKQSRPILKMAARMKTYFSKFNNIFENFTVNLTNLTKKTLRLTTEVFKLAGTNIILAGAYLFLAASKIFVAVSLITLVIANAVEIATKLVLLSAVIIFTIGIMTMIAAYAAVVLSSIVVGISLAFGTIMLVSILVTATLLASSFAVAAATLASLAMTAGSAIIMAGAMVVGAMIVAAAGLLSVVPVALSVLAAGLLVSSALILGGGVLATSAYALGISAFAMASIFMVLADILAISMAQASASVLSVAASVSASAFSLLTVFTFGLTTQLSLSLALLSAALILTVAVQTAAILAAVAVLTAAAVAMSLVLLLGIFIVLALGLQYLWDRVVEELKKTTLYDWWTKDVAQAGGLCEWIKSWFFNQWPWLTDIWGYIKENVVNAFHNTWLYQWWTDEVEAAGGFWEWIKFKLSEAWDWMLDLPDRIWNNFQDALSNTFKQLLNFKDTFLQALNSWWSESPLRECLESIFKWLNSAKEKITGAAKKTIDKAANTMTFGLVDGIKDIGSNYDQATSTMADTTMNINRHTNEFVERVSPEKLDAEIDRLQKMWENTRKHATNIESGTVYAQGLHKLRQKRNLLWLNDALALLQANSTDLQQLTSKREYLYKWRNTYTRGDGKRQTVLDTIKRLDEQISGIKNGSVKVTVQDSGIDALDSQRQSEKIVVPQAQSVKDGEKRRHDALNNQTKTLNQISTGENDESVERYQPIPVPVPVNRPGNMIFMR